MSNQKIGTKAQRKAIRMNATGNHHVIPAHIHIPSMNDHGVMRMFSPPTEEEHLVYSKPNAVVDIRFHTLVLNPTPQTICELCGEDVLLEPFMQYDKYAHTRVCHTCMTTHVSQCAKCGNDTTSVELAIMRDGTTHLICHECRLSYFSQCDVCGIVCYDAISTTVNGKTMCPHCVTEYKKKNYYCGRCDTWIATELKMVSPRNNHAICPSCFATEIREAANIGKPKKQIQPYVKTDGSVFFSTEGGTKRFYGVELEAQNGREPSEQEDTLLQELWNFKECVIKRDGSISRGFETVTFPLEINYHVKYFNWHKYCQILEQYGFKGHEDPDAGFHIHASKAAWGATPTTQKKKLPALVYLLDREDWRKEWKKFSRRANKYVMHCIHEGDFHGGDDPFSYCRFYDIRWNDCSIIEGYAKAIDINKSQRNKILNFWTYNSAGNHVQSPVTVEWRMNKSTLVPDTIFATLEMYDVLVNISAGKWTEEKLRAMRWEDLCRAIPGKYNHLAKYLKDQKIWRV